MHFCPSNDGSMFSYSAVLLWLIVFHNIKGTSICHEIKSICGNIYSHVIFLILWLMITVSFVINFVV